MVMYPVVGREHVLSVLTGYMDATLEGCGACVLLEGQIGMGKTSILKTMALEGADRGLAVAYVRAGAGDESAIVRELIIFLRHVMVGEVDLHDREFEDLVGPNTNPFLLADNLSEMIQGAARRRPLLIILDDTDRADEVSSVALHALVRSLASAPVLSLVARRPVPARSLAQHAIGWLCDHATAQMSLGPLDDEAVAALCASVLGAKPDSSVLIWAARCGGNPWLVENLMSALRDAGRLVILDGTASVLADDLPVSVLSAVHRRLLDVVPAGVRNLLVQGGRVGPRFTVEEAGALPGASSSDLSSSVDEAVQVGLVRRCGEKLTFVHEVVGKAMQHLAASPEPAPDSPEPEPKAGSSPSEWTSVNARTVPPERSSDRQPVMAPQSCGCEDIAARVISALGDLVDPSRSLARALGLLAGTGRAAQASRLADVAVRAGLDTAAEAHLVLELVPRLRNAGCHDMSIGHLRRTLARPDLRESDRTRLADLQADLAAPGPGVHIPGGRLGSVGWTDGGSPAPTGDHPDDRVIDAADTLPEPIRSSCDVCGCPSWVWMIRALIAADQFEEAAAVAAAIKQATQARGEPWPELRWQGNRAELLATLGRLGEARVAAETGLRLSDGSAPEDSVPARALLARISLHYGDTDTASEHLRTAERLLTDDAVADKIRLDWALAQFHAACGRPGMAVQTLLNVHAKVAPDTLLFVEAPTAAAMLVRLARRAGLEAEAERAANIARRVTELNPDVESLAGGAEHAEGLLRRDPARLRRAVEYYRRGGRPLATGIALEDTADAEHESRHQHQAVELLGSALELYVQCDARRDVIRVQKKLRRLGAHDAGGPGVDRPTSGWHSLTDAELRVIRMIVDGKTNKEAASTLFLSPHTVDSHLRRVFAKLRINTRVELTKHFLAHETTGDANRGAAA
jgi:DNA-binding CsgD family transcriptional regulator